MDFRKWQAERLIDLRMTEIEKSLHPGLFQIRERARRKKKSVRDYLRTDFRERRRFHNRSFSFNERLGRLAEWYKVSPREVLPAIRQDMAENGEKAFIRARERVKALWDKKWADCHFGL